MSGSGLPTGTTTRRNLTSFGAVRETSFLRPGGPRTATGSVLVNRRVGRRSVGVARQHVFHQRHRSDGNHDAHDDSHNQTGHGTLLLRAYSGLDGWTVALVASTSE